MDRSRKIELSGRVRSTLLILGLAVIYCGAARVHIREVNVEIDKADQSAYLSYGRNMAATHYRWVGGRNQMPVFPFLVSLLDRPGMTLEQLFVRAKYMNTGLSLLVLLGILALCRRSLPMLEAATSTSIVAFTVYVYRAGYAQAELLFYGLFFLCFLLALRTLERPTPANAALTGIAMGIAYLTKASVLPLLAAFVFAAVLAALTLGRPREGEAAGQRIRALRATLVAVGCFLLVVSPYISTSKARFGQWFYNVNSSVYMWADSWEEVKQTMTGTGDREHWPDLPAEQLPGPRRYLQQHTVGDIGERIAKGLYTSELRHLGRSFGYGKFLIFYSLLVAVAVLRDRDRFVRLCIAHRSWLRTLFATSVVVGYMIAIAFYSPIVRGPRLVLALYLPVMFCAFWFLSREPVRSAPILRIGALDLRPRHFHLTSLVVLAFDVIFRMPKIIASDFAGS